MSVKVIEDLRLARPGCAVTVDWVQDVDYIWDGDGPDPADLGMVANRVTVRATEVQDGRIYTGEAYMFGVYEPLGGALPEDVHGYIGDLVAEAVSELDAELSRAKKGV